MSIRADLEAACDDLAAGQLPDEAGRRLVVQAVQTFMERDIGSRREARAECDRLVIEMAEKCAAHLVSARAKAALVAKIARRYEAGRWRFHRDRLRLPEELREQPERFVWLVLKTLGEFPGHEKIRKIL